jgi:hypothetical protein
MMRIAAYFDVRPVRFIGSRQGIGPSPIVCWPAAHPLVLTWSHFNFPISIQLAQSLSDRSRPKLSRIWRERDGHAVASLDWADLITSDARTCPITLIQSRTNFPLPAAPLAALGPSSYVRKVRCGSLG